MLSAHRGLYLLLLPQKFGTALSSICHPNLTKLKHDSKQFFLLICFRMGKTFNCNKCGGHHIRPINRNCKLEKNMDEPMDMNSQILKEPPIGSPDQDQLLPALATLRQWRTIQDQVDTRIRELQGIEKDKFKSQRGGSETIWVKKEVAWPHNHVLGESLKNRVTYDNLTISQWVSGFATIIRDENDLATKK